MSAEESSKKVRLDSGQVDSTNKPTKSRGVVKKKAGNERAGKRARLMHRKSEKCGYELVRESKVIWEHLRQQDNAPSRTLALEEIMALAHGHFKEVSGRSY